jgi:hypothetical protein
VHATDVDELHADVKHTPSERLELAVNSMLPKDKPVTVTDAPLLCGAFSSPYDATGASKENPRI